MNLKTPKKFDSFRHMHVSQSRKDAANYTVMCESEWAVIQEYIGSPSRVLELGCGLGRMSVYINQMIGGRTHYILADSNGRPKGIKFGWDPPRAFYNDLGATAEFCELNGLENFEIFDLAHRDIIELLPVDMVMSFLAVGFHFPIEDYIDKLIQITKTGGTMIFGIRKGAYTDQAFAKYFEKVVLIPQDQRIVTKEDMLILKGLRCNTT